MANSTLLTLKTNYLVFCFGLLSQSGNGNSSLHPQIILTLMLLMHIVGEIILRKSSFARSLRNVTRMQDFPKEIIYLCNGEMMISKFCMVHQILIHSRFNCRSESKTWGSTFFPLHLSHRNISSSWEFVFYSISFLSQKLHTKEKRKLSLVLSSCTFHPCKV